MEQNHYTQDVYGYKAAVMKELSQDKEFSAFIPKTIYIPDMVFYKFLSEDGEAYEKSLAWLDASKNKTGDEADAVFEQLQEIINERYVPFIRREIPDLEKRVTKELGEGKKVIVRSSGLEDLTESINAGGNRSIPEVDPQDVYEAIKEVVLSYFSPKVLRTLHTAMPLKSTDPFAFPCPVFIQEMIGSASWEADTEMYPRMDEDILTELAKRVLQLKKKFNRDVDTEWVLRSENAVVSVVAFSRDPYFGASCVYMLCSLGVGSAVKRTAIVNATHYILPCMDERIDHSILIEYPEKKTSPFAIEKPEMWLVQCRPAGMVSSEVQVNDTMQACTIEQLKQMGRIYPFTSVIVGKGDVDGLFLISESISEAWEEYIQSIAMEKYVGCIVRHGSALEHAGIMFAEKRMPIVKVDDDVFALLATKQESVFSLCFSRGIFLENKEKRSFSYSCQPNTQIPLHFANALITSSEETNAIKIDKAEDVSSYRLWMVFNELVKVSEKLLKDKKLWKDAYRRFNMAGIKALSLSDGALQKGLQVYMRLFSFLERLQESSLEWLLWSKIAEGFIHSEIRYSYASHETVIFESALSVVKREWHQWNVAEKISFFKTYAFDFPPYREEEFFISALFSLSREETEYLSADLKAKYEAYHHFLEQYGCVSNKQMLSFYTYCFDKDLQEKDREILAFLLKESDSLEIATLYIDMVTMKTTIGNDEIRGMIQECVWKFACSNIKANILAVQVVLAYGGLGDLDVLMREKGQSINEFMEVLSRLNLSRLCKNLRAIFENYQRGILDQYVTQLSKIRDMLCMDLERLCSFDAHKNTNGISSILGNIITNLTSTIIELFDIEGKSYANSLALDIHSVYAKYVAHLSQWNDFLRHFLLMEDIQYSEVVDIVDQKLKELRLKRNDRICIAVDNMWYEKMTMSIDFNPHELQNILHQASIYFADKRNRFYPSEFVDKIHKSLITFNLTNRRLLRNQSDCIEVEMGLGNLKLHKSSIIIRASRIDAIYTEAPLLSIGRILVLQRIFQALSDKYPNYHISSRLQKRSEDHLLFVYMDVVSGKFSLDDLAFGVNIICAIFDAFELGGGTSDRSAIYFNETFCSSAAFIEFLVKMVAYHERLIYSDNMGGGMEEDDVCIYQSLIALMVLFPERFHVLLEAKGFQDMIQIICMDLQKREWKTDRYNLSEGWLERALCMCLCIAYPRQLRNALASPERENLPNPSLCELYLSIVDANVG